MIERCLGPLAQIDWSFLNDTGALAVILAVGGSMLVAITAIIAHVWRRHREAAYEADLKRQMIERGLSAQEIERVIRATGRPADEED